MLHSILVPLDGSQLSERAIPYAETIARASGAKLMFLRAVLTTGSLSPAAFQFNTDLREGASSYLAEQVELSNARGIKAKPLVWEDEAGYAILKAIEVKRPDLIVMSSHGRTGLGRVIRGSVADRVIREARVPVLLVPRNAETQWSDLDSTRLVLPLDGSSLAEEALGPATELARLLRAEVILVQAIDPEAWLVPNADGWTLLDSSAEGVRSELMRAASDYLGSVATKLNTQGINASVLVREGRPDRVIRDAVRDNRAHAIVMATHGRGGAIRLVMGSVAEKLLRSAQVPLITIRPAAALRHADQKVPSFPQRSITLTMSVSEVELARSALLHFINSNRSGRNLVQAFDLLTRLQSAVSPAVTDAAAVAEAPAPKR